MHCLILSRLVHDDIMDLMTFYDPDSQHFKAALVVEGRDLSRLSAGLGWDV